MKKVIDFIKRNSWIWIVVVVAAAYIGDLYLQKKLNPQVGPTPTPVAQIASFKSITPGISTELDLNKILGTPVKTVISGNEKIDEYKSTSELRLHSAIIENGKVVFIKEIISANDTTTASSITDIYGKAQNILYSKLPNSTFNLYAYPSNGIAYLGHADGTLLEIWYFQPTTVDNLLQTRATDYSLTPSTEILQ